MQAQNQICVLDIDIQGVKNIKKTDLNPIYISVQPPSIEILVSARLALPLAVRGNQRPALQPRGSPFSQPPLCSQGSALGGEDIPKHFSAQSSSPASGSQG